MLPPSSSPDLFCAVDSLWPLSLFSLPISSVGFSTPPYGWPMPFSLSFRSAERRFVRPRGRMLISPPFCAHRPFRRGVFFTIDSLRHRGEGLL